MKVFQFFIVVLAFLTIFAVPAIAQKEKTLVISNDKIALINPKAFENEESGIKDLLTAYGKVQMELKAQTEELKVLAAKLQEIEKEILRYQEIMNKDWTGHSNVYSKATAKFEEYQKLHCEFREKHEIYKSLREKRNAEIVTPKIGKIDAALKQFARQNGYAVILDSSENNYSAIVEGKAVDITKEFIRFYNDYTEKEKTQ